jgi:ABC-type transporter Mla maintaining outer membrane lipid asymmetry ATPase subunit MlaF
MNPSSESGRPPVLELRGVSAGTSRDPEAVLAADVNWTVAAGDFWAVAGLQGAGKSDFLMLAAGLLPPRTGEHRLFGEPLAGLGESRLPQRLRVGMVFDGGQLLNHLTVYDNVALPARYHRQLPPAEIEQAVQTMLEATGLLPWASNRPGTVPRAWRKRAGLARALMLRPELLLLDCPLSGLDGRHVRWWLHWLAALARGHALLEGHPLTLVVTGEDPWVWRGHARQFALLDDRQFLGLGDWAQVEQSAHPTVRALLAGPRAG